MVEHVYLVQVLVKHVVGPGQANVQVVLMDIIVLVRGVLNVMSAVKPVQVVVVDGAQVVRMVIIIANGAVALGIVIHVVLGVLVQVAQIV